MAKLSKQTRQKAIEWLMPCILESMFNGSNMLDEHVKAGINFKGLNNYTDDELYDELHRYTGNDEPIFQQVKFELEIEEVLLGD